MVVIALPLHLHAPVAIDCLQAGKHVLCEKLMAWNISQCKEMIRAADSQRQAPVDRPSAPLQPALRPRRGADQLRRARRHPPHPRPVAPQQAARTATAWRRSRSRTEDRRRPLEPTHPPSSATRHGRAVPLAALPPHRRRPHGRAGQPSARRLQHLPRQGPSAGRHAASAASASTTTTARSRTTSICTFEFPGKNYDPQQAAPRPRQRQSRITTAPSPSPTRRSAPTASRPTANA